MSSKIIHELNPNGNRNIIPWRTCLRHHLERCVNGTRKIRDVLRSRAMDDFKFWGWSGTDFRFVGPALPVDQSNNMLMRQFCRRTVSTIWHYHGGCVAGRVVDHNLKVVGVNSLRVVDGSTFTVSPGTNPQATLLMLGRYMGMKILRDRMRKSSDWFLVLHGDVA